MADIKSLFEASKKAQLRKQSGKPEDFYMLKLPGEVLQQLAHSKSKGAFVALFLISRWRYITKTVEFSVPSELIEKFFANRQRFIEALDRLQELGLIEVQRERNKKIRVKLLADL